MIIAGTDIETTGLTFGDHRIVEVYIGLWDLDTRELVLELNERVDPQRSIDAKAQAVHGISAAALIGKPDWNAIGPKVRTVLDQADVFVAHNDEFDYPFLEYEIRRIGLKMPALKRFCTMTNGRWATPVGKVPNLGELCFACGVEYDPSKAHAADYDVDRMMQCFFQAYDWGFFKFPLEAA